MRIVVLTQYYPPEPIPKPHELARGLAERGHEVVVITGFPNYPAGKLYPDTRLRCCCSIARQCPGWPGGGDICRTSAADDRPGSLGHWTAPPGPIPLCGQ